MQEAVTYVGFSTPRFQFKVFEKKEKKLVVMQNESK